MLFLCLLALPAALLPSCSQPVTVSPAAQAVTLRELSQNRSSSVAWTQEMEAVGEASASVSGMDPSISATPGNIIASGASVPPRYPSLHGFTSLDVSALDSSQLGLLRSFCDAFGSTQDRWLSASSLMSRGRGYALVVFAYDFCTFAQSLGLSPHEEPCVSSYYLGSPFVTEGMVQCPVRLVMADGLSHADVSVWLSDDGGRWGISHMTWMEEVR